MLVSASQLGLQVLAPNYWLQLVGMHEERHESLLLNHTGAPQTKSLPKW